MFTMSRSVYRAAVSPEASDALIRLLGHVSKVRGGSRRQDDLRGREYSVAAPEYNVSRAFAL